jgi:LysM repeat protein
MKRKQKKFLILLTLAVVIVTYNQKKMSFVSLNSPKKISDVAVPEKTKVLFDPEEEFQRLKKKILLAEEDPEILQSIQEAGNFVEGNEESSKNSKSTEKSGKAGESALADSGEKDYIEYEIQERDNLSKISKKFYGTPNKWKLIFRCQYRYHPLRKNICALALNSVFLKSFMKRRNRPQQKQISPKTHGEPYPTKTIATETGKTYTIQQYDNLYKIAKKVFNDGNRWEDILQWNHKVIDDPQRLRPGTVLVIKD